MSGGAAGGARAGGRRGPEAGRRASGRAEAGVPRVRAEAADGINSVSFVEASTVAKSLESSTVFFLSSRRRSSRCFSIAPKSASTTGMLS